MNIAVRLARPALDTREQPLNTRPISMDGVIRNGGVVFEPVPVLYEYGNQVFGSREKEYIGFFSIEILWKTFVGLARDCRQAQAPAETV